MRVDGVSHQNLQQFNAATLLPDRPPVDQLVNGGLKRFFNNTLGSMRGGVGAEALHSFVGAVVDYEQDLPIFSPFRYAGAPRIADLELDGSAETTVVSALSNMRYMIDRFDPEVFAATGYRRRNERAVTWRAPIDDTYEMRIRGGSGAGAFSIDLGIGAIDNTRSRPSYKELWRTGIDTIHAAGAMGARFIRTGSGIKHGDTAKEKAFDDFRQRHRILPQRLLGLTSLYLMRELEPDYVLALSTEGAKRLSSLNHSKSPCDYTGIFTDIGFQPSDDPNWLVINDFPDNFYAALERAGIKKHEGHRLHEAVQSVNSMDLATGGSTSTASRLFRLCTDESRQTLERELAVALPPVENSD